MARNAVFEFVLFGLLGLGLEVAFTAVLDFFESRDTRLLGYSSLLYFPFYGLTPLFFRHAGPLLFPLAWPWRGLIYVLVGFSAEYVSMGALRLAFGRSPSEESYRRRRWNVHGLIRLDFAPAWFAAGFLFEFFFRVLN